MKRAPLIRAVFALFCAVLATAARGSAEITFSLESGLVDAPFTLSFKSSGGFPIRFSTDGSMPDMTSGTEYTGPIRVAQTTVIRAVEFRAEQPSGACETRTFIFPVQVMRQNGRGFPASWGVTNGVPVQADYEMDPEIVTNAAYRNLIVPALKSIPSVFVALPVEDLFGRARGIYAHPLESGVEWERAASFEFVAADGSSRVRADCGLRIQGGWNRRPEESPKHALRVLFKKKYGSEHFRAPIFGTNGASEFHTLVLRAGCNNSWLHWSGTERRRGDSIRDQWMRDTMREMGHPSAAGTFVHLYLNGIYWGVYNLTERPDEHFAAAHLGGKAKDWDARNADKILSGDGNAWNELMAVVNRGLQSESDFAAATARIDLDEFIDYMIVNFYGANADWDRSSNWYAARRRNPPGKFQFFVWDGERTLENATDNTINFDDDQSPPRIFQKLRENAKFRTQFAERARMHLSADGALSPNRAAARYRRWSDRLDLAIIAESARWGDYRRDVHRYREGPYELYTRNGHWRPEVNRLLNDYFPRRATKLAEQFRRCALFAEPPSKTRN